MSFCCPSTPARHGCTRITPTWVHVVCGLAASTFAYSHIHRPSLHACKETKTTVQSAKLGRAQNAVVARNYAGVRVPSSFAPLLLQRRVQAQFLFEGRHLPLTVHLVSASPPRGSPAHRTAPRTMRSPLLTPSIRASLPPPDEARKGIEAISQISPSPNPIRHPRHTTCQLSPERTTHDARSPHTTQEGKERRIAAQRLSYRTSPAGARPKEERRI
ncbi:hypothetical protein DFH08DRAFT_877863 [Mycena albidolilacea]|uniref:Uncharacterized protein n=1 Tax=Mycena albidolilacea TaxID=1033008 RepID=A0AAD6ZRY4_9AGAR|nr:hypothetical protein DFH08DRAFT_877863 [Mycena albidolilacea]